MAFKNIMLGEIMKFAFWDRISLRKKLFSLVVLMIFSLLFSIIGAYYIIDRVKIGGRIFHGIELKTNRVDALAATRVNVTMLGSMLKSQIFENYDPDAIKGLDSMMQRIGTGISEMNATLSSAGQAGQLSCVSCHEESHNAEVKEYSDQAANAWSQMKLDINDRILPALARDDEDVAEGIFNGEYYDHYFEIMSSTKQEVDILREAQQTVRDSMSHEANFLLLLYMSGGIISAFAVTGLAIFALK